MIHHIGITVHDLAASTEFYRDPLQAGAAHVAITVADLDATLERLRERGYVLDPDRVRVELVRLPA